MSIRKERRGACLGSGGAGVRLFVLRMRSLGPLCSLLSLRALTSFDRYVG